MTALKLGEVYHEWQLLTNKNHRLDEKQPKPHTISTYTSHILTVLRTSKFKVLSARG